MALSHPGKALWPQAAGDDAPVTKLDLARYYETVSGWMLPHVHGRMCSIVRIPEGLDGEAFFQRHLGKTPSALFDTIEMTGDPDPYLAINRPEALIAVAQVSGVEIHPSNGRPGLPEVPGRLIFDLDPGPSVAFDRVVEAAWEIHDRLDHLGLIGFAKTTGGKGLHVVTPLAAGSHGWDEAKAFARDICARMAAESPDRYLIGMAKDQRVGRIFLDYLRNDRMSTAVAPLSPRARAGATVSMPLSWSQVKKGLDPNRFTVRTAPGLLEMSSAWADWRDAERPLADAMRGLA